MLTITDSGHGRPMSLSFCLLPLSSARALAPVILIRFHSFAPSSLRSPEQGAEQHGTDVPHSHVPGQVPKAGVRDHLHVRPGLRLVLSGSRRKCSGGPARGRHQYRGPRHLDPQQHVASIAHHLSPAESKAGRWAAAFDPAFSTFLFLFLLLLLFRQGVDQHGHTFVSSKRCTSHWQLGTRILHKYNPGSAGICL